MKITGLATFAASYPLARRFQVEGDSTTPPIFDSLSRLFHYPESARVIGTEYLRQNPGERNIEILTREISGVDTQHRAQGDLRVPRIEATSIGRKIRDDFEKGRMTQVGGWYLAETEARTCALLSLCVPVTG
jgi:hypothetical protein